MVSTIGKFVNKNNEMYGYEEELFYQYLHTLLKHKRNENIPNIVIMIK